MLDSLLITGANGFVGRSVLDKIVSLPEDQRPNEIGLVIRREFPQINQLIEQGLNIKLIFADLTEPWMFDRDYSHVIQLAADGSNRAYGNAACSDFVKITQRFLHWCHLSNNVPSTFHASSGACFGYKGLDKSLLSDTDWNKKKFVESRLQAENLLKNAHEEGRLNLRIGRLFSFLGGHISTKAQYAAPSFITMAKRDGVVRVTGNPSTVRSYLDANDMADWILKSLLNDECGEILSIGSSVEVTILELAKEVARLIDAKVEVIPTVSPPDWYVAENQETMNTLAVKETKSWEESIIELVQKF